ncbi:MAG: hypothetical protein MUE40_12350 [Anaerolineae bacterium]|nr:hypothetical protein [Anaerolineae bacterium]
MQSTSTGTGYIVRKEWRWVTLVSLTLLAVAFAPFLILVLRNNPAADWRFMGLLHQFQEMTGYLARVQQGSEGLWLAHLQHTPEPHRSALIQPVYALLGQVARLVGLSSVVVFHVARLIAAFIMYIALYHLAACIWLKVRTRRIFFVVAAVGSGLGWLSVLSGATGTVDLTLPHLYPFFSSMVNVHYPLTIACLALLAAILIEVFRPGMTDHPGVNNSGLAAVLLSLALALLYPEALLPLGAALFASVAVVWWHTRRIDRELRWLVWLLVPALPVLAYYAVTLRINPAVADWVMQRAAPAVDLAALIPGLGLPLLLALPGLWRALRRFESDGDRLMLLWLLTMLAGALSPLHGLALAGLLLPVAYFATRSMEDVWLPRLGRRWRTRLYIVGVPALALTHLLVLFLPMTPLLVDEADYTGTALEPDYVAAFRWLATQVNRDDVILAEPDEVGAWLPVWTGARVVYGHPEETLHAARRYAEVRGWYRATTADDPLCRAVLAQDGYQVVFVVLGPRERRLGPAACTGTLRFAASFGQVSLYALPDDP